MIVKSLELDFFRNYVHLEAVFDPRVKPDLWRQRPGQDQPAGSGGLSVHRSVPPGPVRPGDDHAGSGWGLCQGRGALPGPGLHSGGPAEPGARRQLWSNGVRLKTAGELSGILNTVLFCPEDLLLIREGAAARRRFLDCAICQLRPRYEQALSEYNRLYDHKVRILRDWQENLSLLSTLDDFNLRMAQTGALIVHYRAHFIRRLQESAPAIHRDFSGERRSSPCGMRPSPPSQTPWPEPKPSCPSCWSTSRPIGRRSWTAVSVCPAPIRTTWQWRSTGTRPRPTAPRGRPARRPSP